MSFSSLVHLVTVVMQASWAQRRISQGPGSESRQRARFPDQSVCAFKERIHKSTKWFAKVLAIMQFNMHHHLYRFTHIETMIVVLVLIMSHVSWPTHPVLNEPRHKFDHLLLCSGSIVPLCALTHWIGHNENTMKTILLTSVEQQPWVTGDALASAKTKLLLENKDNIYMWTD